MQNDRDNSSLTLVTLATLVMGSDYALGLLFPNWGLVLSLNRVVFGGLLVLDYLNHPAKYRVGGPICVVCFFILLTCIPFLVCVEVDVSGPLDSFKEAVGLLGTFGYMLFFYVNCRSTRVASRICVVLFFCSVLMTVYLLGIVLGITGEADMARRGAVEFTRAGGHFDPNTVVLYLISCFAFGPFLALYSNAFVGFWKGMAVLAVVCLGLYVTLQLNSRSGTIVLGAALSSSLLFRGLLAPPQIPFSRISGICFVAVFVSITVFLQFKYGIFDTIVSIYGETHLATDTSFAVRLCAYQYLGEEILFGAEFPSLWGTPAGYCEFWHLSGDKYNPHCTPVDVYIKGGLVFLFIYCGLLASSMVGCLRSAIYGRDATRRAVSAGLFTFLLAFIPLMITLSVESAKMPWGIIGCALGFTAYMRRSAIAMKSGE